MITITGKIIKDAETGTTKNDQHYLRFTLVCNSERWKDKITGEQKEKATFVNCIKFSKDEQKVAEWIKKGAIITVNAKQLEAKLFDKNDGNGVNANIEASVENLKIEMFAPKKEQQQQEQEQTAEIFTHQTETTDDLPF
jgi:single-stranded DNA-binding protein